MEQTFQASRNPDRYGVSVVSEPQDHPKLDIVFVHGLSGHPRATWTSEKDDVFWPADLLPGHLPESGARVLVYGYHANVTSFTDEIHNNTENLVASLTAMRRLTNTDKTPIIFVAHSLGGLLVKDALIDGSGTQNQNTSTSRTIYLSTYGIIFLGTPHQASNLTPWATLLESICGVALPKEIFDSQRDLVQALQSGSEFLQNINRLFIELMCKFRMVFFHEAKKSNVMGASRYIVDEESAAPAFPDVERLSIEQDHLRMCKFGSESSPGFHRVTSRIRALAEDASSAISERWERESLEVINRKTYAVAHERGFVRQLHGAAYEQDYQYVMGREETLYFDSDVDSLSGIDTAAKNNEDRTKEGQAQRLPIDFQEDIQIRQLALIDRERKALIKELAEKETKARGRELAGLALEESNAIQRSTSNKIDTSPQRRSLLVTEDGVGLEVLYERASDHETDPSVDVVAIHGIGIDPKKAWCKPVDAASAEGQSINWLKDTRMLPAIIPSSRIMRYGYRSDLVRGETFGQKAAVLAPSLLRSLQKARRRCMTRPIIFIAHCYGGYVVMKAAIEANHHPLWSRIFNHTCGMIFFGTPFRNASTLTPDEIFSIIHRGYIGIQPLSTLSHPQGKISGASKDLAEIVTAYLSLWRQPRRYRVQCFFEGKPTEIKAGTKSEEAVLVDKASGCLEEDEGELIEDCPFFRDHKTINLFSEPKEEGFYDVCEAVDEMFNEDLSGSEW